MDEQDILSQLNDSQRAAVEYCDGPQLVIAGAGSGKTRVLTYKIAYLLTRGMQPWNILALTFTNKAAREMKDRIGQLVGAEAARLLNMGTFHSVFARILRAEAAAIGYSPSFTIYDQLDSRQLVKDIIAEMGLDEKKYKPADVASRISLAKNHVVRPSDYGRSPLSNTDAACQVPALGQVYAAYCERLRQANAMDFDDLLLHTLLLFEGDEAVRRKWVGRFHYVLVDEYQDTNTVQQRIVHLLTRERQLICVVGDDAQSIYSFRGADIDNILGFCQLYDGARQFKLERNYRSTQHIVEAANSLISRNQRQIPKNVFSENEAGERVQFYTALSDREEAKVVGNEIRRVKQADGCTYGDFAILYRTNAQSRLFEEELRKLEIPYRIYGGLSFYQRKEIKDALAYFRLVANPDDEEALRRIINYPTRGIGPTTVGKVAFTAIDRGVSLWQVVADPAAHGLALGAAAQARLDDFRQMVEAWRARLEADDAFALATDIIKQSGMSKDIYTGRDPEQVARQENVDELMSSLRDFVDTGRGEGGDGHVLLPDFLQQVALMTTLDADDGEELPRVLLMTIHSAKGLEFPNVFVAGVEENILPSQTASYTLRGVEEERRLLYVAITRAERRCYLTCAESRYRYGHMEFGTPSRFIKDIDPRHLHAMRPGGRGFGASPFRSTAPVAAPVAKPRALGLALGGATVKEGQVVESMAFGRGKVMAVEGEGGDAKATIAFDKFGTKKVLLKYARLNVVG